MSKDQRAPGGLEQVRAFVNTSDIEKGSEELGSAEALADWLRARGLVATQVRATNLDLENALRLREALRAILLAHNEGGPVPPDAANTIDETGRRARIVLRFDETASATLEPEAEGIDAGLGRLLSIVHQAITDGTWKRLKACRLHSCEWAFYDHTKNHSGAWCNMDVCGNRAKARAYRERRGSRA